MVKRISNSKKLLELLKESKVAKAGVFSDATYPNGDKVATIAFWNEFGTKTAPPRPFFRDAINSNKEKWKETILKALKATNFNVDRALAMVGEEMVGDIRESIIKGSFAPNSPVTLLLKSRFPMNPEDITFKDFISAVNDVEKGISGKGGNNKPLNWTGTLLRSISYEVGDES